MNKEQENKLTMYEAVAAVLQKHEVANAGIAPLVTAKADVLGLLQNIKDKGRSRKEATAGKAASKAQAREELIALLVPLASTVYIFGRKTKNEEAAAIADVKQGSLQRMRDTELSARATSIHAWAAAHIGTLGSYGVTPEMLTEVDTALAAYATALSGREAGFAERVGATAALAELFRHMDTLLRDEVDRLAQSTRRSNPDFYLEYFAARVVKDLGGRRAAAVQPVSPAPPPPPDQPPASA